MDIGTALQVLDRFSNELLITESEIRGLTNEEFKVLFGFYIFRSPTGKQLEILNEVRREFL